MEKYNSDFSDLFIGAKKGGTKHYRKIMLLTILDLTKSIEEISSPSSTSNYSKIHNILSKINFLPKKNKNFDEVLEFVIEDIVKKSVIVYHPFCVAHLHCPPLIHSIAAEVIIATLNQSLDSYDQAPTASYAEQFMIDNLCKLIGFDGNADGTFTSGGTQSNLIALLLARDCAIKRDQSALHSNYSVKHFGLPSNLSRYKIICSEEAHFSSSKAASIIGLGSQSIVKVPTKRDGSMCTAELKKIFINLKLRNEVPIAVVATAGTTDLGSFDSILEISKLCKKHQCWLHVDAAYGGIMLLSNNKKQLEGINLADSISIDFHKMFFQVISCGGLFVKSKDSLSPLCFHTDYLSREDDDELNLVDKSISTTRRFNSLKLLMSFQSIGMDKYGKMIDKLISLASYAATLIKFNNKLELFCDPSLTTVVFRFSNMPLDINKDLFHKSLRKHLFYSSLAIIAETRLNRDIYLKITLMNPCTNQKDIRQLLSMIEEEGLKLMSETNFKREI